MNSEANNIIPLHPAKKPSEWAKTPDGCIFTRVSNGVKYVRTRIGGRLFVRSLRTKFQAIARRRAYELIDREYKRQAKRPDDKLTFGNLSDIFITEITSDCRLKERSKAYRLETLEQLWGTWPQIIKLFPRRLTESDCLAWASRARGRYSATRFNGTLETLRRLIKIAIDKGLMLDDPTINIERAFVPIVDKAFPRFQQLPAFINALDNPIFEKQRFTDGRANHIEKYRIDRLIQHRRKGGAMLKFMLFTGCRPGAARLVMPENIDLARNEIVLPMIKYDNRPVRVPIFPQAKPFFEQLLKDYPGSGPLLPVGDPSKTLASACKEVGIPKLVPSDMRDLFATVALMHTKDVALVASWLGHKDRGVTLLKRYAHIFDDYAQALMKKVHIFNPVSAATVECQQTISNRSTATKGTSWKPESKSTWTA